MSLDNVQHLLAKPTIEAPADLAEVLRLCQAQFQSQASGSPGGRPTVPAFEGLQQAGGGKGALSDKLAATLTTARQRVDLLLRALGGGALGAGTLEAVAAMVDAHRARATRDQLARAILQRPADYARQSPAVKAHLLARLATLAPEDATRGRKDPATCLRSQSAMAAMLGTMLTDRAEREAIARLLGPSWISHYQAMIVDPTMRNVAAQAMASVR